MRWLALVALLGVMFSTSLAAEQRLLRAVVDDWAPLGGKELRNGGISLDVMSTILSRLGYNVEPHIVPWERALEGIKTGEYDVIGNIFHLPELEEHLTYTQPFYESDGSIDELLVKHR